MSHNSYLSPSSKSAGIPFVSLSSIKQNFIRQSGFRRRNVEIIDMDVDRAGVHPDRFNDRARNILLNFRPDAVRVFLCFQDDENVRINRFPIDFQLDARMRRMRGDARNAFRFDSRLDHDRFNNFRRNRRYPGSAVFFFCHFSINLSAKKRF